MLNENYPKHSIDDDSFHIPHEAVLIVGGDVCPTPSNQELLTEDPLLVFGELADIFHEADQTIVNLECPYTDSEQKLRKTGPNLKTSPSVLAGLHTAGISAGILANNHIMDYGTQGLKDTISQLNRLGMPFVGAGNDLREAQKILYLPVAKKKVAIIAIAEHEYSIASESNPGCNPIDPFYLVSAISEAKQNSDVLLIVLHGGAEEYDLPSPDLQKLCRRLSELGADIIICQHSHCIGTYEQFNNSHILYGQGNLLFDYKDADTWQSGLLVKINLYKDNYDIDLIPVVKDGNRVSLANADKAKDILKKMHERSCFLRNSDLLEKEWRKFCNTRKVYYLHLFLGNYFIFRVINKLTRGEFLTRWYLKAAMALHNILRCETHNEIAKTIFSELSEKK